MIVCVDINKPEDRILCVFFTLATLPRSFSSKKNTSNTDHQECQKGCLLVRPPYHHVPFRRRRWRRQRLVPWRDQEPGVPWVSPPGRVRFRMRRPNPIFVRRRPPPQRTRSSRRGAAMVVMILISIIIVSSNNNNINIPTCQLGFGRIRIRLPPPNRILRHLPRRRAF